MQPGRLGNTIKEEDDKDGEDEIPDFPTQNSSGTAADDDNSEIQILIDALHFGSSDEDRVDDDEPVIFLQDLETRPVMLDVRATQDIFQKMEEVTLGESMWFPLKMFQTVTLPVIVADSSRSGDVSISADQTTVTRSQVEGPPRRTRRQAAAEIETSRLEQLDSSTSGDVGISADQTSVTRSQVEGPRRRTCHQVPAEIETSRLEHLDIFSSPRKRPSHNTVKLPPALPLKKPFLSNPLPVILPELDTTVKTSSTSTLVYTATLKQFRMAYNTSYNCIICIEYATAIPFNGLVEHAYTGDIAIWEWNELKKIYSKVPPRKHNCPRIPKVSKAPRSIGTKGQQMPKKDIQDLIISELTEKIGRKPNPLTRGAGSRLLGDERRLELRR